MPTQTKTDRLPVHHEGGTVVRKFSKARSIAARYGLCPKTIFRLADRGLVHRYKLNARVVVFDDNEIAALFDSARVPAPAPTSEWRGIARAKVEDSGKKLDVT